MRLWAQVSGCGLRGLRGRQSFVHNAGFSDAEICGLRQRRWYRFRWESTPFVPRDEAGGVGSRQDSDCLTRAMLRAIGSVAIGDDKSSLC